mmetsp:Transcript_61555/g.176556  ORF Transcript_61555/g.176556 Transcript_61555/m.176556 type:complete len:222 (-) Transcript_61555:1307-1972(-)
MAPQDLVGLAALRPEGLVAGRSEASHAFDHLLADPHRWRERLRVLAKDVPEVDVKQAPVLGDHEVVQMPVSDPQDVGDDTIPCTAPDEVLQHVGFDAVVVVRAPVAFCLPLGVVRMMGPEELLDIVVVILQDSGQVGGILDELDEPVGRREGHHLIRRELQVHTVPLQYGVHEDDKLQDELVLPEVVALLHHDLLDEHPRPALPIRGDLASEHGRVHGRFQ